MKHSLQGALKAARLDEYSDERDLNVRVRGGHYLHAICWTAIWCGADLLEPYALPLRFEAPRHLEQATVGINDHNRGGTNAALNALAIMRLRFANHTLALRSESHFAKTCSAAPPL